MVSAQNQQQAATKPAQTTTPDAAPTVSRTLSPVPEPEFTGVFYLLREGVLVPLPHEQPRVSAKFKYSLILGKSGMEVGSSPTFVLRMEGSGDPAQYVRTAPVEDGKVSLKKDSMSSFARTTSLNFRNMGNRVFEVTPVVALPKGDHVLAVKADSPFAVPECFIFRVTGTK